MTTSLVIDRSQFPPELIAEWEADGLLDDMVAAGFKDTNVRVFVQRRFFNPNHDQRSGRFAPGVGNKGMIRPEWLPPGSPGGPPVKGGGKMPLPDQFGSSTEASNWLHENYGVEASFTGMDRPEDLVTLHDVAGGIKDAADKYPETVDQSKLGSLRFIRNGDTGDDVARTIPDMPFGRRAVNGAPERGTIIEFDPVALRAVTSQGGGLTSDWLVAKDARGIMSHEMGHVYAASAGGGGHLLGLPAKMASITSWRAEKGANFPSVYAQSSAGEMFAEVFTLSVNPKARAGTDETKYRSIVSAYNKSVRGLGYGDLR